MYALATCTASILRGTATDDDYLDVVDTTTVVATGLLCAIRETASRVHDKTSEAPRVVRVLHAQLQSDVDARVEDRLRDDTHGVIYVIDNVTTLGGPGYAPDLELELRRTT
jgi:hypothetical protein